MGYFFTLLEWEFYFFMEKENFKNKNNFEKAQKNSSLTEEKYQQTLFQEMGKKLPNPEYLCVHNLFEQQVKETPEATAVVFKEQQLNYQDLNQRSNQFAHYLLEEIKNGEKAIVGIYMDRSLEMIVALLGVLKAGAAYLPLDPSYPKERLAFIVKDANISILITQSWLVNEIFVSDINVICIDSNLQLINLRSSENLVTQVSSQDLAYVIYTSGSTGQPKGVQIVHRSLVNYALAIGCQFKLGDQDRVLQFASISFDAAAEEIFPCLLHGATLILRTELMVSSMATFLKQCNDWRVSVLCLPTAYWHEIVSALDNSRLKLPKTLRLVYIGGEKVLPKRLESWWKHAGKNVCLVNGYGPTETTIVATNCDISDENKVKSWSCVPIGRPIANVQTYILDLNLRPVPIGIPGELHIGGVGLARGYLHRPELTAQKFITSQFYPGLVLYKTGDLCRYLHDGNIEFLGRIDHQVKIRGFRVELGEIEACLRQHSSVDDSVVILHEDSIDNQNTNLQRLVGYVVAKQNSKVSENELREFIRDKIPPYMIPSMFVIMEALPLNVNGKIDRAALPIPKVLGQKATYVAPKTPLETFLSETWKTILGLEKVGIHENFFELGGDSFKSALFINQLQEKIGESVYVVALFDSPTIADLALYLRQHYRTEVLSVFFNEPVGKGELNNSALEQIDDLKITQIRQLIDKANLRKAPEKSIKYKEKNPQAIFVLSPPRSGSTLTRILLAGHPNLFAPPELELLSFNTLVERKASLTGRYSFYREGTIRAIMEIQKCDMESAVEFIEKCENDKITIKDFYGLMQQKLEGKILVDKTSSYALSRATLKRIETYFENPLYIHLSRNPYGMIQSFEKVRLEQIFFRYEHCFTRRELAELVWLISHQNILQFLQEVPVTRQHHVKFEDIVNEPEKTLRKLCGFINVDFYPDMLKPYEENKTRMTDGIHPLSKMVGDPTFHQHKRINPEVAEQWKHNYSGSDLANTTKFVAQKLGYELLNSFQKSSQPAPRISLPLVGIQSGEDSLPFFCVHPSGGTVLCFLELARFLGRRQPFYGLQARGIDGKQPPYTQLETVATYYNDAIKSLQPKGPYLLGGWSLGGIIAFEMAQQLQKQGYEVGLLALIDSSVPENTPINDAGLAYMFAQDMKTRLGGSFVVSYEALQELESEKHLDHIFTQIEKDDSSRQLLSQINSGQMYSLLSVFKANIRAVRSYRPQLYNGKITLLLAQNSTVPHSAWDIFSLQPVDVQTIPGNHYSILKEPNVKILAEKLKMQIKEQLNSFSRVSNK
jgi:amino acid adenylation domain-containing protein